MWTGGPSPIRNKRKVSNPATGSCSTNISLISLQGKTPRPLVGGLLGHKSPAGISRRGTSPTSSYHTPPPALSPRRRRRSPFPPGTSRHRAPAARRGIKGGALAVPDGEHAVPLSPPFHWAVSLHSFCKLNVLVVINTMAVISKLYEGCVHHRRPSPVKGRGGGLCKLLNGGREAGEALERRRGRWRMGRHKPGDMPRLGPCGRGASCRDQWRGWSPIIGEGPARPPDAPPAQRPARPPDAPPQVLVPPSCVCVRHCPEPPAGGHTLWGEEWEGQRK